MIVLTASTPNQADLTDIQRQSALIFGASENEHVCLTIPKSYPRPPSWFKIQAILRHLPNHDFIWWMDSDAMFVAKDHWHWASLEFQKTEATVLICQDYNGFNCGVMVWRRCEESESSLWRIYDSYERFKDHPWFEQGSFHTMAESIAPHILPKRFNAYENELAEDSLVLHLPATSHTHRLKMMHHSLSQLKALP